MKNKYLNYLYIPLIFIITRILFIGIAYHNTGIYYEKFSDVFFIRDAEWYMLIANNGYTKTDEMAFFPLVPMLIKIIGPYAVILLNNILSIIIAFLLHKNYSHFSAIMFLVSPIQVFTFVLYTESLFITLTFLAYLLYKSKKYILSGTLLGLSIMCRSTGSMLFFAIAIVFIINVIKKKEKFSNMLIMFFPATLIACIYPLLLQIKAGSWKMFITTQYENWDKIKGNIISIILTDLEWIKPQTDFDSYICVFVSWFFILFTITTFIKYKSMDFESILYFLFTLIITTSCMKKVNINLVPPSTSIFRYLIAAFPIYTAYYKTKNKIIKTVIIFSFFIWNIFVSYSFLSIQKVV